MKIEVDPVDVDKKKADDRGRVSIGLEHAGKTVTIAIVDVED